jgi:hypothetical protein
MAEPENRKIEFPKIRPVDAFPVESGGQRLIGLRDPANWTDRVLYLSVPAFFLVSLMDGKHTLLDIQASFLERFGELLLSEKITELVRQLDENLMLESENFERHRLRLESEFRQAAMRPAALAGRSYPAEVPALQAFLKSSFDSTTTPETARVQAFQAPRAIISPHLDLREASSSYALAYDQIRPYRYDLFVILGTAHGPTENLFTATRKDFGTPLGTVKTNHPLVAQLAQQYGDRLLQDEFLHKTEHSVEFQCIYLQYLFGFRQKFSILPILCGSFQPFLEQKKPASEVAEFADFVGSLREILQACGLKVCLIASADLSHVGLRFGDSRPVDDLTLTSLKNRDLEKIEYLEKLNPAGFWSAIQKDKDNTRICGFPCIYTMLSLLGEGKGNLLHYGQMDDRVTGSAVSYASLVFQ